MTSTRTLSEDRFFADLAFLDPFYGSVITHAVPEMMDLARDELIRIRARKPLSAETSPAAIVSMVLEDTMPMLEPGRGVPLAVLVLQCALLDAMDRVGSPAPRSLEDGLPVPARPAA